MSGPHTPYRGERDPRLPGRVMRRPDVDSAVDALLADLVIHAGNCVRAFGDFHMAVSATPQSEPVLMRLMYDPPYRDFPWVRTRLWMVDELDVPSDHPDRRSTRLNDTLVALSGLPESQFHALDPRAPAHAYQDLLKEHLGWREKGHDRLDYVLLTLLADGRLSGIGEHDGPERATVPMPFVESARFIAVFGPEHEEADAGPFKPGVIPIGGELIWYLSEGSSTPSLEVG